MNRKPERRHSVELEALDEQDQRPYKYVLKRERDLLPRPRFYSKCPDARGISPEHAGFLLRLSSAKTSRTRAREIGERKERK